MYKLFHKASQNSETTDNLQASGKILQEADWWADGLADGKKGWSPPCPRPYHSAVAEPFPWALPPFSLFPTWQASRCFSKNPQLGQMKPPSILLSTVIPLDSRLPTHYEPKFESSWHHSLLIFVLLWPPLPLCRLPGRCSSPTDSSCSSWIPWNKTHP